MKKYIIPLACILLAGCTQDNSLNSGETAREYLKLWMQHWNADNGKNVTQDASGIYILEDIPGTGALWTPDSVYTYGRVTVKSLSGKITTTDNEDLAKQLGTYVANGYYGPSFFGTGEGVSYAGVDATLKGMRMGGTRTVVIPAWLITTSRYDTEEEYIDACSSTSNLIYTLSPVSQTSSVERIEKEMLAEYIAGKYPGLKSTSYDSETEADGTFFIKYLNDTTKLTRHAKDTTVALSYTGHRLDGTVFDTTDEKTAKDAGIYDSSRTYGSYSVKFSTDWNSISLDGSTSLINGFKGGLSLMDYWGQKAVIMFTSSHGYAATGKGSSIPAYTPLVFEMDLSTKK